MDSNENYLLVDVGGSSIKYAISGENGYVALKGSFKTPDNIEDFYQGIIDVFNTYEDVAGVAMSCPGAVDSDTGIIGGSSALPYIHGPNIKETLEKKLGVRVELENDANCAALAEVWKGAAKETEDSCFIVCGTGIGGAVIKDRKIHKGKHLHGGEFGYMISSYDLEKEEFEHWSMQSTVAIVKGVAKELGVDPDTLDGKDIFDNEDNNPIYKKYVDRFYYHLAMGIYNIQYSFDPEVIVVGGGISAREDLVEQVNKRLDKILASITEAKIRPLVRKCQYQNDANLMGALYHFLNKK